MDLVHRESVYTKHESLSLKIIHYIELAKKERYQKVQNKLVQNTLVILISETYMEKVLQHVTYQDDSSDTTTYGWQNTYKCSSMTPVNNMITMREREFLKEECSKEHKEEKANDGGIHLKIDTG